ncbi:hypothetical protein APHWI1_0154 [Anaplasma phagocytophilum str. ApWI1]|uniref:Uncharacterized protein n=2 Tax=Anaplasma phagocytophilum TaxID=948 RepID=A0A0F3NE88_ANAPH|nr:hypothetical protein YYU_03160 [Anaplasma phagocytophilum str. HZ2]AGR80669.1 hypothetical protein WSQ_03150 [Anaplasma phagocytophilum str. JM]AGR81925.1 hypothetical protein YYY_03155 [Anaplasma phagocytophilum str. Dog2]KJV60009.1 hypothetical protein APHWEB_1360 [Anaplasma phagocytophilum str. Webster]KJV65224.1 hypothetical protein EPHNCH_0968 [Anaplasma phagocytophilum str. NCH-1]KJV83244.1 hypothetical protein APHHGE2_0951 [Anaplasma phagocytophilum str. HGE2]KJV84187.1 hypothetical
MGLSFLLEKGYLIEGNADVFGMYYAVVSEISNTFSLWHVT